LKPEAYEIAVARWPEDLDEARRLLTNYGLHLASSPVAAAGFCLSGYEAELAGLPGKYATEDADVFVARVSDDPAGCVAITRRTLPDGLEAAEMKRLWVEPAFRGYGVGRGLVLAAVEWTRRHRGVAVVLDTVNEAMPEAARLYLSMGFAEVVRFNDNPIEGVRFYQLRLP
jgi:GNAT superfamily N-acetyltransferase